MSYTVYLNNNRLINNETGTEVFRNEGSADFNAYLQWLDAGGIVTELGNDPSDCVDIKYTIIQAVQTHLDTVAQSRGYDGILSLCSYATSKHPRFSKEAAAGVIWRDAVWEFIYEFEAGVQNGTKHFVSIEQLLEALPPMVWE